MDNSLRIFAYETLSPKYKIEPDMLKKIIAEARKEFGEDEMMVELHVVRALRHSRCQGN
jgi:hypothetical protein